MNSSAFHGCPISFYPVMSVDLFVIKEFLRLNRLRQMGVHTDIQGLLNILHKGVGRHGDDGDALRFRMVRGADEPRWANRKLEKAVAQRKAF